MNQCKSKPCNWGSDCTVKDFYSGHIYHLSNLQIMNQNHPNHEIWFKYYQIQNNKLCIISYFFTFFQSHLCDHFEFNINLKYTHTIT